MSRKGTIISKFHPSPEGLGTSKTTVAQCSDRPRNGELQKDRSLVSLFLLAFNFVATGNDAAHGGIVFGHFLVDSGVT
jgi:hypothetical protein